ncbi:MAG: helix-turn-helix domain-containing protein [Nostoc sp.]|uniref:helix-turn-helix domain-containing protein n=1 Tax=Nostoc sp. TaxID=1180 RepID=UPI002FF70142
MAKQPNIGKVVRALRQELNLSQEKIAAKFGVTFATINRWGKWKCNTFSFSNTAN